MQTARTPSWPGSSTRRSRLIVPPPSPGSHKPSTVWPIQRFLWSDYEAYAGDKVQYRVVPMVGTPDQLIEAKVSGPRRPHHLTTPQ